MPLALWKILDFVWFLGWNRCISKVCDLWLDCMLYEKLTYNQENSSCYRGPNFSTWIMLMPQLPRIHTRAEMLHDGFQDLFLVYFDTTRNGVLMKVEMGF